MPLLSCSMCVRDKHLRTKGSTGHAESVATSDFFTHSHYAYIFLVWTPFMWQINHVIELYTFMYINILVRFWVQSGCMWPPQIAYVPLQVFNLLELVPDGTVNGFKGRQRQLYRKELAVHWHSFFCTLNWQEALSFFVPGHLINR